MRKTFYVKEGFSLIASNPPQQSECEQLLALLRRYDEHACVKDVLRDACDVQRLMTLYSFHSHRPAEQFADRLSARYHREILSLFGPSASARRQSDSSYLRLEQLFSLLLRVAAMRLSRDGTLSLSPTQITQSDGLLLLALQKETGRG